MPASVIDNVHLPQDIETGAMLGPSFSTSVVGLAGGSEQRNVNWDQEKFKANVAYGVMARDDPADQEEGWQRIVQFFRARRGRARGFLFRDWTDYEASDEMVYRVPTGDARRFQLGKRYDSYLRRITRPAVQSVKLYYGPARVEIPPGGVTVGNVVVPGWTVEPLGIIAFAADIPDADKYSYFASFIFDVPVRFDIDEMAVSLLYTDAGSIPSIDIIQVPE